VSRLMTRPAVSGSMCHAGGLELGSFCKQEG
jgi:hypothetical protein